MRRIYVLPNLFTAGSLFCGLLAIFEALALHEGGELVKACQWIFIAGFLDVFDGLVARLTRTESEFGLNFDSLADVISFGAAPAILAYMSVAPVYPRLAKATCGLFVVCAAMRLARFNVQARHEEKRVFLGLPTPSAGCMTASLFWTFETHGGMAEFLSVARISPLMMVILAYLMVSKFRYLSFKSLRLRSRQPFELLVIIVVILALLLAFKHHIELILMTGFLCYALSGPLLSLYRWKTSAASAGDAEIHRDTSSPAP